MGELLAVTCDSCGEPMVPNVSTLDEDGCGWICLNPGCPELAAGELEAEDLVEAGVPEALAGRLARLIDHYVDAEEARAREADAPARTRERAQADLARLRGSSCSSWGASPRRGRPSPPTSNDVARRLVPQRRLRRGAGRQAVPGRRRRPVRHGRPYGRRRRRGLHRIDAELPGFMPPEPLDSAEEGGAEGGSLGAAGEAASPRRMERSAPRGPPSCSAAVRQGYTLRAACDIPHVRHAVSLHDDPPLFRRGLRRHGRRHQRGGDSYDGVIPTYRYHVPYMPSDELRDEIAAGVCFWGWLGNDGLGGLMGVQDVDDVTLIRHAYVAPRHQGTGVGCRPLAHFMGLPHRPLLVGTWADAAWTVRFYERHGFRPVTLEEKGPAAAALLADPRAPGGDVRWCCGRSSSVARLTA